jgi:hypothetical protein
MLLAKVTPVSEDGSNSIRIAVAELSFSPVLPADGLHPEMMKQKLPREKKNRLDKVDWRDMADSIEERRKGIEF